MRKVVLSDVPALFFHGKDQNLIFPWYNVENAMEFSELVTGSLIIPEETYFLV